MACKSVPKKALVPETIKYGHPKDIFDIKGLKKQKSYDPEIDVYGNKVDGEFHGRVVEVGNFSEPFRMRTYVNGVLNGPAAECVNIYRHPIEIGIVDSLSTTDRLIFYSYKEGKLDGYHITIFGYKTRRFNDHGSVIGCDKYEKGKKTIMYKKEEKTTVNFINSFQKSEKESIFVEEGMDNNIIIVLTKDDIIVAEEKWIPKKIY